MIPKLFVDSDVIIDFFADREPFANAASELFELNEQGKIEIQISVLSISNVYYILKKYLDAHQAIEVIKSLINLSQIITVSKEEIIQALGNDFTDFEDSIQYSSALTIENCEAIITRNVKDYKNSEIAVFLPEDYLKMI